MKLILVGPGAFGAKHAEAIAKIDGANIVAVVGPNLDQAQTFANQFGIAAIHAALSEALTNEPADAVILTSPTGVHASQARQCLEAGKHVAVEIPAGDNWDDIQRLSAAHKKTGLICMVGHTRRYNPSHQWIRERIAAGNFSIQHMDVQTFFFRRTNTNALGQPRDWTDHLLWHHAAHTVDLFQYQTGEAIKVANILQGPLHSELGITMDMSIQMQSESGKLLTLTLSFNNDGPLGTVFRYIGDTGTYIARYDELVTGNGKSVDVSGIGEGLNGIELQDRDFISCIQNGAEPRASLRRVLPCYRALFQLEEQLNANKGPSQ